MTTCLLSLIVAISLMSSMPDAAKALRIDDFSGAQSSVSPNSTQLTWDVLGGERDLHTPFAGTLSVGGGSLVTRFT
ncbi:MAG: hypothetical protein GY722_15205 [bacterium]|nr:hypothetical protein [bacterium]